MLVRTLLLTSVIGLTMAGSAWSASADLNAAFGIQGQMVSTEDYLQIEQLYARNFHAIDTGSGVAFADTFTEDGELVNGQGPGRANADRSPRKGRQALILAGSNGGARHLMTNLVVNRTAEGAKGSIYLLMYNVRTIPATFVETAIYDDTLVKTPQGWRFKRRVVWRDDDDITPFKAKPRAAGAAPAG